MTLVFTPPRAKQTPVLKAHKLGQTIFVAKPGVRVKCRALCHLFINYPILFTILFMFSVAHFQNFGTVALLCVVEELPRWKKEGIVK